MRIYSTLAALPSSPNPKGEFALREETCFEIEMEETRPLSAVQEILHACKDLMSIACQRHCNYQRLSVFTGYGPQDTREATFHGVPVFKGRQQLRDPIAAELLFTFSDIKDCPVDVFSSWIAHSKRLAAIRSLYFYALYGSTFIEAKFLALMQAVEAFHQRFRDDGVYMNEAEFETKVQVPLCEAIPPCLEDSHKEALKNRIKFANDYSLRKRVGALIADHQSTLDKVVANAEQFVGPMVEQRNLLTHLPPEAVGTQLDSNEWRRYNFILHVLLDMCFLEVMGFADDKIAELVERHYGYKQVARYLDLHK